MASNAADIATEREGKNFDLRTFLSQTFVVYMKTYALHWNYEGPMFHGVHKLTESQCRDMENAINELAERMRALKQVAPVSLTQILGHSSIQELKDNDNHLIKELVQDHRQLSEIARDVAHFAESSGDEFTHDLLVLRSGVHDKFAWMLESLTR